MKIQEMREPIVRRSWDDLRAAGLLLLANQFLHVFGWAICVEVGEDGKATSAYPARVSFRGFDDKSTTEAYRRVSRYMAEHGAELVEESES